MKNLIQEYKQEIAQNDLSERLLDQILGLFQLESLAQINEFKAGANSRANRFLPTFGRK